MPQSHSHGRPGPGRPPARIPGLVAFLAMAMAAAPGARAQEPAAPAVTKEAADQGTPLAPIAVEPFPEAQKKPAYRLEASWDDGLRLRSDDDAFHIHVGG